MPTPTYMGKYHNRQSTRLDDYDYAAPGLYYVTLCTDDRVCLFGDVVDGRMELNDAGNIAHNEWLRTPILRPYVALDKFVVMPDHFHALFAILFRKNAPTATIGDQGIDDSGMTIGDQGMDDSGMTIGDQGMDDSGMTIGDQGMATPCPYTKTLADPMSSRTGMTLPCPMPHAVCCDAPCPVPRAVPPKPAFGKPIAGSVGAILGGFKSAVTYRINKMRQTPRAAVWHTDYNDRIIRNRIELECCRRYIEENPARWWRDHR